MVDVTHDRHDRRTRFQILWLLFTLLERCVLQHHFLVKSDILDLVTEFGSQNGCRLVVEGMVDRHHLPLTHQFLDQLVRLDPHSLGQFTNGNGVADPDNALDGLGNGRFFLLDLALFLAALFLASPASAAVRLENLHAFAFAAAPSPAFAVAVVAALAFLLAAVATLLVSHRSFSGSY